MANETYIVDHLSYSSIRSFLTDRYKFLLETMRVWDFKASPSMLVGQAGHKALEVYYRDHATVDAAIAVGLAHIERTRDVDVHWGKTGSREEVIKKFTFAINAYFEEEPKDEGEQIAVEEKITEFVTVDERFGMTNRFDLPLCGVLDRIIRTPDGLIIRDHKFKGSYTPGEGNSPEHLIQALCYYHIVKPHYCKDGERILRCIFDEVKTSKNKDGSPQRQEWVVNFEEIPEWFALFYKLYGDVLTELAKTDISFLPNPFDQMNGEESLAAYMSEVVGITRPRLVQHKTGDYEIEVPEKQYVPSKADRIENVDLTPEEKIRTKLQEFGIAVKMQGTDDGYAITRYTLKPSRGVPMAKFGAHVKDLAIALKATSVRIEAPIPGTDLVGVEVPKLEDARTYPKLTDEQIAGIPGPTLDIPIGVDVRGETVESDLAVMPHLLVAGRTGAGKSVFLNNMLRTLSGRNTPDDLKIILIDPKRVELKPFEHLPHVIGKSIHEIDKATKALALLVEEMERRYTILEAGGMRDIDEINRFGTMMHRIVVVIDEFADLILQAKEKRKKQGKKQKTTEITSKKGKITLKETDGEEPTAEDMIVRLAQKSRAVGIHLVLATQRPSVDVVTGIIKANLPTRIAFACFSSIDSKVVIDRPGAECLVGNGDLLFIDPRFGSPQRLQGFSL